jgi:hypothetical protein
MTNSRLSLGASVVVGMLLAAGPAYAVVEARHRPPLSAQAGQPLDLYIEVDDLSRRNTVEQYYITVSYDVVDVDGGVTTKTVWTTINNPLVSVQLVEMTIPGSDIRVPSINYSIWVQEVGRVCGTIACSTVYSSAALGPYTVPVNS